MARNFDKELAKYRSNSGSSRSNQRSTSESNSSSRSTHSHSHHRKKSPQQGFSNEAKRNRMYKLLCDVDIQIKKGFKWDEEGLWSFTNYDIAVRMARMLLEVPGLSQDSCITDCMSSIGGNTIPFAQTFKTVNAIELNSVRFELLKHNLELCGIKNVQVVNGYFQQFLSSVKQDVIYLDPPWGTDYKKFETLRLSISDEDGVKVPLEDVICSMRTVSPVVMVKLPRNYDMSHFVEQTSDSFTVVKEEDYNPPNSMKIVVLMVV